MKLLKNIIYNILSVQETILRKRLSATIGAKHLSKRKRRYSNGCTLDLNSMAEAEKQKLEEEMNLILKKYDYEPEKILEYIKNQGTGVYYLEKALELNPQHAQLYNNLGTSYVTIGNLEKAYENYRINNNRYPNTGEPGTGATSAGQGGVFTNVDGQAVVSYTYNGEEKSEEYAMPVIQLTPGTLIIEKEITGLGEEAIDELLGKLKFAVSLNGGMASEHSFSEFDPDLGNGGVFKYKIEGLSPNTSYEITETGKDVEDYNCITTVGNAETDTAEGKVGKGETETVRFKNAYEISDHLLTIKKIVDSNMTDDEEEFSFTLTLRKGNTHYTEALAVTEGINASVRAGGELTVEKGKDSYTFTLKDDGSVTLKIPDGVEYSIAESESGYDVSYQIVENEKFIVGNRYDSTLKGDTTITFKNSREIAPPTGIRDNVIPFSMMLLTATAGTVWFGLLGRRRRSA